MSTILIHSDTHKAVQFTRTVETVQQDCNSLIDTFHAFQDWRRITTLAEFEALVRDAGGHFDATLLSNIDLKVTGNKLPDPGGLASLLGIDRESYMSIILGKYVSDPACRPCAGLKIRRGTTAISYDQYIGYAQYLIFDEGLFSVDEAAVSKALAQFDFYADQNDPTLRHFEGLIRTLNFHDSKYTIAVNDKITIARSLKLMLTEGTSGQFMYNNELIKNLILTSNEKY